MPNWRKDQRKSRQNEGKCAIAGCPRDQVLTYYGFGLCTVHEDYYFDEDKPSAFLKKVLGLPVSAAAYDEAVKTYHREQHEIHQAIKDEEERLEEDEFDKKLIANMKLRETRAEKRIVDGNYGRPPIPVQGV